MSDKIKINSTRPGIHIDSIKGQSNPYPIYKLWREQHPVFQLEPNDIWAICRHKDVKFALKRHDLFSSGGAMKIFQPEWLEKKYWRRLSFLVEDPPEHTRQRKMVSRAFASNTLELLIPFMRNTAQSLLSKISPHQDIEFIEEFASPYSSGIIDHIIGTEDSRNLNEIRMFTQQNEQNISSKPDPQYIKTLQDSILTRNAYFESIIQKRHRDPGDDLISKLISMKVDGKKITDDIISNVVELLLLSGTNSLTHSLCHAMILFSRRPDLFRSLQKNSDFIPAFIEELVRYSSIATGVLRKTREDVTLSGVTIPKGDQVLLFIPAANHDPDMFSNPDEFDMSRPNIKDHLAFGFGPHLCLGNHLARIEIQVVLEYLLKTFNGVSCPPDDEIKWNNTWMVNTVEELPVRFQ